MEYYHKPANHYVLARTHTLNYQTMYIHAYAHVYSLAKSPIMIWKRYDVSICKVCV